MATRAIRKDEIDTWKAEQKTYVAEHSYFKTGDGGSMLWIRASLQGNNVLAGKTLTWTFSDGKDFNGHISTGTGSSNYMYLLGQRSIMPGVNTGSGTIYRNIVLHLYTSDTVSSAPSNVAISPDSTAKILWSNVLSGGSLRTPESDYDSNKIGIIPNVQGIQLTGKASGKHNGLLTFWFNSNYKLYLGTGDVNNGSGTFIQGYTNKFNETYSAVEYVLEDTLTPRGWNIEYSLSSVRDEYFCKVSIPIPVDTTSMSTLTGEFVGSGKWRFWNSKFTIK